VGARPVVVVLGATVEEPPPGLEAAHELAEVRVAADAAALAETIADAEVVFFWRGEPGWLPSVWPHAGRVRWIQSASDGVDGLLFPELVARDDVRVTNSRGIFEEPIAEWVVGSMLAVTTGLHRSIVDQQTRRWDDGRHRERLAGARLLVVGPGPVGRATAVRARALGMQVAAVGRTSRDDDLFGRVGGPDDLHHMLGEADHVLDALPLTDATRHRFDAAAFAAMRPTAWFTNVGRGDTVDETALIEALRTGVIAGACLDVFEWEPLPSSSPLWTMPNVIVSPHVSGDVEGWERQVVDLFVENLARFVRGQPLRNPVDAAAGFGVG